MKLLTLFVRYGDQEYYGAFKRLGQFYQRIYGLDYDVVLIDTSLPIATQVSLGSNGVLIGGDNSRREFSGWDTALDQFPSLLDGYDLVHIVTSAFENEYNGFYPYINREMLDYVFAHDNIVLCHVDTYPDAVRLFGRSFQTWGCSKSIFAVPNRIRQFKTFVGQFGKEDIFEQSVSAPFRDSAPLSANYREYLLNWLTGEGLPHGQWHSIFEISEASLERFHSKAMSIVDEHNLSMLFRETGGRLVDYTWLHSRSCDVDSATIPDELTQVVQRNQFLFEEPIIIPSLDLKDYPTHRAMNSLFDAEFENKLAFYRTPLIEALWLGNQTMSKQFNLANELHLAAIHINQDIKMNGSQLRWLIEIDEQVEQDGALNISRGLHALYLSRHDLRSTISLQTSEGRERLINWWMQDGMQDPLYSDLMPTHIYSELDPSIPQDTVLPITRGLHALYLSRHYLRDFFDIETTSGRSMLSQWHKKFGQSKLVFVKPEPKLTKLSYAGSFRKGGVNIIGFGRGELGIGEDVRMASLSLSKQEIDHCIPRLPLRLGTRQKDTSIIHFETKVPLYNVNLIFLPNYEMIRLAAMSGNDILERRYNVACWQWELPKFPKGLELSINLVDEIWSSTTYTAEAMRASTGKSVLVMPMAVKLPELSRDYTRAEFNLPEQAFVFLTVLDGNSSIIRKNPLATVNAFQQAFPPGMSGVHLLLKTTNIDNASSPDWGEILLRCRNDCRITLISETLSREQVIGLQSVCDCFVSLHRAEGFGRNIAEAMLLGKPVIVSDFSGNTDFTNDSTAFMVSGKTIPVRQGQYPFAEGQHWFDVDITVAVDMMHLCVDNAAERASRAAAGQAFVATQYSPETVGWNYVSRLNALKELGKVT